MTNHGSPAVTVIVPTRALPARRELLKRAVASILSQDGVRAVPLIVVNGHKAGTEAVRAWCTDARVVLSAIQPANLPMALQAGRRLVETPFFAELDDDDVLLPGALATRVRVLTERDDCDVVVTNGLDRTAEGDRLHVPDMATVRGDPVKALLTQNWLLPGSWLCRTDRFGEDVFDGMPRYRECTYLALVFSTRSRMAFVDEPTVAYHADTMDSESKSREYMIGSLAAGRKLLELDLPAGVRAQLRRTVLASGYRSIARVHLSERRFVAAVAAYARSALQPGGMQYLLQRSFTREPRP